MECYLEHANITVLDLDEAVKFVTTALPHFRIRGRGEQDQGDWKLTWLHVGTDDTYISLMQTDIVALGERQLKDSTGINHVGFVVEDVEAVKGRLETGGYKAVYALPHHPHRKRLYSTDPSGVTWEFVEYLSDNPAERNDYEL